MKKIAILGITGSIGSSAVRVVNAHPELFQIVLASSQNNYRQLLNLARSLKIPNIVLTNAALKNSITDVPSGTRLFFGEETLLRLLVETPCDLVLNAISGSAGLDFTVTALENDLDLALANKESLVLAGHIIRKILTRSHSRLIPVDSEHSAIFQALG
ncbi:MAG: 1-deoxy-D-xylulose-5-phosphate reductoisomerase, partial [Candidatus Cloacimonetes bacterium]|nr:1-deoxy-D-xylulose-5-phosphate reductoisomerase [Candidatus Cloacimonadota bacterium]